MPCLRIRGRSETLDSSEHASWEHAIGILCSGSERQARCIERFAMRHRFGLLALLLRSYGRGGERGTARPEVLQELLKTTDRVVQASDADNSCWTCWQGLTQ